MKSKVLTILLSVAIAFGLWLYVITVERTQVETTFYNIPVILDGESVLEDRGLMITSETDLKVNLRLFGNRPALNNLKNSDITVMVDLTRIYEEGEKKLTYDVFFPGVESGAIEIMNRDPSTITLVVEQWSTKEVPVVLDIGDSAIPVGYELLESQVNFETVTIRGPKKVVDQIHMAKVSVSGDEIWNNLKPNSDVVVVQKQHTLCGAEGNAIADVSDVTVNRGEIRATMKISKVADIPFIYEVKPGGGLTAADVKITLDNAFLTVAGSALEMEALKAISLGVIDLSGIAIQDGVSFTRPVSISETLTNISGITEVTVTVEFIPETTTVVMEVPISQFVAVNKPQNLEPSYVTQKLRVTLRGHAEDMKKLQVSDIVVEVDLTDANVKANYPATIRINGSDRIGALGTYVVNVSLMGV